VQPSARRRLEQLVVRDAAPQEERQARGELEIADAVSVAGSKGYAIALDSEQEFGIDQHALDNRLDAGVESAVAGAIVEAEQRSDVALLGRPPERAAGKRRRDLRRTARLVLRRARMAREQPPPARRVSWALWVERPFQFDRAHAAGAKADVANRQMRWRQTLGHCRPSDQRDANQPRAGLGCEARGEHRIRGAFGGRPRRPGREQRDPFAVQPHVDLLACSTSGASLQPNAHHVLGIERNLITKRQTAARAERQFLVDAVVLRQQPRDRKRLDDRARRRGTDDHSRDTPRREQISIHQTRGHGERPGVVVEAVALIVGGQQRPRIDLHGKEIADRVRIFHPVQAVQGRTTRVRPARRRFVERRLQPCSGIGDRRGIGSRRSWRRHCSRAQLGRAGHLSQIVAGRGPGPRASIRSRSSLGRIATRSVIRQKGVT
jgi:hypothetical protein